MWQYHYHLSWRSDHLTQNVTIGYGWYLVLLGLVGAIVCIRMAPSIRTYRRSKKRGH